MLRAIFLCLTALTIVAQADPSFFNNCANEIRSSLPLISQFNQELTNRNLAQIRNDFASLQTLVNSINKLCDHMVRIAGTIPSPELSTCDGIVEDLRSNVQNFIQKNPPLDFDIVQILGYLTSKAAVFSSMCSVTEQKSETLIKRILGLTDFQKIQDPTPECLSQVYQALSTLYGFEADASDQDISDMESDYEALMGISNDLNNFCTPKIVMNASYTPDSGDCDVALQNIGNILTQFGNSDPSDATNVIGTIQALWNEYPGFKQNCVTSKQAKKLDAKNCKSYYFVALEKLFSVMMDAAAYDKKKLLQHVKEFGLSLEEINQNCKPGLQIDLSFSNVEGGKCQEHLVALKDVVTAAGDLKELKDLKKLVENVWRLSNNVLREC